MFDGLTPQEQWTRAVMTVDLLHLMNVCDPQVVLALPAICSSEKQVAAPPPELYS